MIEFLDSVIPGPLKFIFGHLGWNLIAILAACIHKRAAKLTKIKGDNLSSEVSFWLHVALSILIFLKIMGLDLMEMGGKWFLYGGLIGATVLYIWAFRGHVMEINKADWKKHLLGCFLCIFLYFVVVITLTEQIEVYTP